MNQILLLHLTSDVSKFNPLSSILTTNATVFFTVSNVPNHELDGQDSVPDISIE